MGDFHIGKEIMHAQLINKKQIIYK
jgi:hypothetical protein